MSAAADNTESADSATRPDTRLVIHLYRQYELPVTFTPDTGLLTGAMQARLMWQVQEFQADFVARIGQLRHNYLNWVRRVAHGTEPVNHRGVYQQSLGWYQAHRPELYEGFKRLLLDVRDLLPDLPPSPLAGLDEPIAQRLRRFEAEATAVIVQPVRDMALKLLTRALVGEGALTEQAMLVFFDLRDTDFSRPGFAKLIARVIRDRQRLYFRRGVPEDLLTGNINVLQGQLDGHCSHLLSLLTSRDMSGYVRQTLSAIRARHLPVVLGRVLHELDALDAHRAAVFAHTAGGRPLCLKDLLLTSLADPGGLGAVIDVVDAALRDDAEPVPVDEVRRAVGALRRFGAGIDGLPEDDLELKVEVLRLALIAAVDAALDLLRADRRVGERLESAVRPLLGLIAFDAGGQSEFYARWFPDLHALLERDGRRPAYATALRRLRARWLQVDDAVAAWSARLQPCFPEPGADDLCDVGDALPDLLASAYVVLQPAARGPGWFHGLESRIFADVERRRGLARRGVAPGPGRQEAS